MSDAKRSASSTRGKKKTPTKTSKASKKVMVEMEELENSPRNSPEAFESVEEIVTAQIDSDCEIGNEKIETKNQGDEALQNTEAPLEPSFETSEIGETKAVPEEVKTEPIRARLSDEYLVQCFFDKNLNQFVATILEFEQIKAVGSSKSDVIRDCENRLESHLNLLRRQGEAIPETLQSRQYPDFLEVPISQGLFRRLDLLSRHEKISFDQLVVELLSGMIEKRLQAPAPTRNQHSMGSRPQQQQSHQGGHRDNYRSGHRDNHREGGHREPRRDGQRDNNYRGGQSQDRDNDNIGNQRRSFQGNNSQNRGRGRDFNNTQESRENFLEYVRNLEKGNLKKR
ncbi:MAG: hypothetical protein EXR74_07115 [Bdellovibrionales bacterium]|nr:hypothetical protein [Bdellovibrionales bacterium]